MIPDEHLAVLDALIERLESSALLDIASMYEIREKRQAQIVSDMFYKGKTHGEASGAHPILLQDQPDFEAQLQSIKQSLINQVQIFTHGVDAWFSKGDHPPPYYPLRIAVILRKNNEIDREKRFLAAYCKHFATRRGSRGDERIMERAIKLGAY